MGPQVIAMSLKRPKSIVFLIAVFVWSLLRGAELLTRGSNSADRALFAEVGLGLQSTGALALIAVLDLAAIRYLIKPAPVGRLVCLASIGLSALQTSIGFVIARVHPEAARRAIVVSRESRGLPVREDALQTIMD